MLEGVRLSDYADNKAFFGTGAGSDYNNILGMSTEMYRELRLIKRVPEVEGSVDRRYISAMEGRFSSTSTEAPIEYKAPAKGATPMATQHRSIYFESNSAEMSLDSRAVVDEIAQMMRAYGNTVVDIEGNTDSTGSRGYNVDLSRRRAETVRRYLEQRGFPSQRMRALGNGPDRPLANNDNPEGREKNRRTDIKVYPNPAAM
jgi:outer membrane protein OmpA-like peptidoglycan-associated protein